MKYLEIEKKRNTGELADRATLRRLFSQKPEISINEATAIFEKHQLGTVQSLKTLQANIMNVIFELTPERGDPIILKIQYRPVGGLLETEHYVTRLLKESTQLPLPDFCLLDTEKDILLYPYLLRSKIQGEAGRNFFERSDNTSRMQIMEELGYILGIIHSQKISEPEFLGNEARLDQWRSIIEKSLLNDKTFMEEVSVISEGFYPQFNELMASVNIDIVDKELLLLWCDPALQNLLVERDGKMAHITGLFDFQPASYGSCLFDIVEVEKDFEVRQPREIYGNPGYIEQFYKGYKQTGREMGVFENTHRILRDVILAARGIRFWWDCAEILHPTTPSLLEYILNGLAKLS